MQPRYWSAQHFFSNYSTEFIDTYVYIHIYIYTHTHTHIDIYIYNIDQAQGQDGWDIGLILFLHFYGLRRSHLDWTSLVNTRFIIWHKEDWKKMIFVLVCFWALKRIQRIQPVICKSDNAFRFSRFLVPSWQRNHREKILFTDTENILQKKTFMHSLGLQRNVIKGRKQAIPSRQYCSVLPTRGACHIIYIYIYIHTYIHTDI